MPADHETIEENETPGTETDTIPAAPRNQQLQPKLQTELEKRSPEECRIKEQREQLLAASDIHQGEIIPIDRTTQDAKAARKASRIKELDVGEQTHEETERHAEVMELALVETAEQAVFDNEPRIRLVQSDNVMANALVQSTAGLAALADAKGDPEFAELAGAALEKSRNQMSEVWQPEKPASQQNSVSEEVLREEQKTSHKDVQGLPNTPHNIPAPEPE